MCLLNVIPLANLTLREVGYCEKFGISFSMVESWVKYSVDHGVIRAGVYFCVDTLGCLTGANALVCRCILGGELLFLVWGAG